MTKKAIKIIDYLPNSFESLGKGNWWGVYREAHPTAADKD